VSDLHPCGPTSAHRIAPLPSAPLASASRGLRLSLSASSVFVPTTLSREPINFASTFSSTRVAVVGLSLLLSVFTTTEWAANPPILFGNPGLTVRVASKLNTFTDAGAGLSAVLTGGTATNTPLVTL